MSWKTLKKKNQTKYAVINGEITIRQSVLMIFNYLFIVKNTRRYIKETRTYELKSLHTRRRGKITYIYKTETKYVLRIIKTFTLFFG